MEEKINKIIPTLYAEIESDGESESKALLGYYMERNSQEKAEAEYIINQDKLRCFLSAQQDSDYRSPDHLTGQPTPVSNALTLIGDHGPGQRGHLFGPEARLERQQKHDAVARGIAGGVEVP
jgi:hypothetical protein